LRLSERGKLVYDLATRAFYPPDVRRRMDDRQKLVGQTINLRARKRSAPTARP
jgi:hypothetical protein